MPPPPPPGGDATATAAYYWSLMQQCAIMAAAAMTNAGASNAAASVATQPFATAVDGAGDRSAGSPAGAVQARRGASRASSAVGAGSSGRRERARAHGGSDKISGGEDEGIEENEGGAAGPVARRDQMDLIAAAAGEEEEEGRRGPRPASGTAAVAHKDASEMYEAGVASAAASDASASSALSSAASPLPAEGLAAAETTGAVRPPDDAEVLGGLALQHAVRRPRSASRPSSSSSGGVASGSGCGNSRSGPRPPNPTVPLPSPPPPPAPLPPARRIVSASGATLVSCALRAAVPPPAPAPAPTAARAGGRAPWRRSGESAHGAAGSRVLPALEEESPTPALPQPPSSTSALPTSRPSSLEKASAAAPRRSSSRARVPVLRAWLGERLVPREDGETMLVVALAAAGGSQLRGQLHGGSSSAGAAHVAGAPGNVAGTSRRRADAALYSAAAQELRGRSTH